MKRLWILLALTALLLCGCSKAPAQAADGTPWSKDWTTVSGLLGAEARKDWTLRRSEDVLAAEGMFYYVWTKGDAVTYTNAFDETVTAYEAEIHLVAAESPERAEAEKLADQWNQLTLERYPQLTQREGSYAGQEFALFAYDSGASATGLRGKWAIHVDVVGPGENDPEAMLTEFLSSLHYVPKEG